MNLHPRWIHTLATISQNLLPILTFLIWRSCLTTFSAKVFLFHLHPPRPTRRWHRVLYFLIKTLRGRIQLYLIMAPLLWIWIVRALMFFIPSTQNTVIWHTSIYHVFRFATSGTDTHHVFQKAVYMDLPQDSIQTQWPSQGMFRRRRGRWRLTGQITGMLCPHTILWNRHHCRPTLAPWQGPAGINNANYTASRQQNRLFRF